MCAVVTPENVEKFMAVRRKWDVLANVIGEVTDGDRSRSAGTARPSSTSRPAPSPTKARCTSGWHGPRADAQRRHLRDPAATEER